MLLALIAVIAGVIGSLLGLGGGLILVPVLTLFYHIPLSQAVAASLVSIVATSSTAGATFLKENLTNIRVGVFLQVATVAGAMTGFLLSGYFSDKVLYFLFSFFLFFSCFMMMRPLRKLAGHDPSLFSQRMKLNTADYQVEKPWPAFFFMFIAGNLSALLGIGSGSLKVLAMDQLMKLPIKVSSATSNFMIGVTAAASCGAYLMRGDGNLDIIFPVVAGISLGSFLGAKLLVRIKDLWLRKIFIGFLLVLGFQMLWKAWQL
jgi:uncharacterized membrane protein YfcA